MDDKEIEKCFQEMDALARRMGDMKHELGAVRYMEGLSEPSRLCIAYAHLSKAFEDFTSIREKVWVEVVKIKMEVK